MSDVGKISAELRTFIERYIHSVATLEVLLFLSRDPSKTWSTEQLNAELRSNLAHCQRLLDELEAAGIVRGMDTDGIQTYAYRPDESILNLVNKLNNVYMSRRLSVINMIYNQPVDKIKLFADAFKIRKE